jgi:hypothetical protein
VNESFAFPVLTVNDYWFLCTHLGLGIYKICLFFDFLGIITILKGRNIKKWDIVIDIDQYYSLISISQVAKFIKNFVGKI